MSNMGSDSNIQKDIVLEQPYPLNFIKLDQGYLMSDDEGMLIPVHSVEEIAGVLQSTINKAITLINSTVPALKKFESIRVVLVIGEGDSLISPPVIDPVVEKFVEAFSKLYPGAEEAKNNILASLQRGAGFPFKVRFNGPINQSFISDRPSDTPGVIKVTGFDDADAARTNNNQGQGYRHDKSNNQKYNQNQGRNFSHDKSNNNKGNNDSLDNQGITKV